MLAFDLAIVAAAGARARLGPPPGLGALGRLHGRDRRPLGDRARRLRHRRGAARARPLRPRSRRCSCWRRSLARESGPLGHLVGAALDRDRPSRRSPASSSRRCSAASAIRRASRSRAAIPLVAARRSCSALGDEFGSAISYHAERGSRSSRWRRRRSSRPSSTPAPRSRVRRGELQLRRPGRRCWPGPLSIAALVFALRARPVGGLAEARRSRHLELATALLAVVVVLSPVLSPQFLFWLLPISAAAYGLGIREHRPPGRLRAHPADAPALRRGSSSTSTRSSSGGSPRATARCSLYLVLVCAPIVRAGLREPRRSRIGPSRPSSLAR